MFPSKALVSLVFIALSAVDASPLSRRTGKASLGFTASIKERTDGVTIADKDRARAQAFKQASHLGKRDGYPVSITDINVNYNAQVGVGNPPTYYNLLIDTGSSNTWVGAGQAYVPTGSSHDTGNTVTVSYGTESNPAKFSGEEWIDTVALSPDLVIQEQSIGVASSVTNIHGIDGILGVGPVDLTVGTVSNTGTVPTVTDNLYAQGTIAEEALGVYFVPASGGTTGELTFGGCDSSFTNYVNYVPITQTSPASTYWGIDQSISYGGQTILSTTAGIVDTGTTLILIATDAFQTYQSLTGGTLDQTTGLLSITPDQYNNLQSLYFNVGRNIYEIIPNAQIWPRSLSSAIGGTSNGIYIVVADIGSPSGGGLDFIDGYTFLERYYSVYDTTNSRVGFAPTAYTDSTSN